MPDQKNSDSESQGSMGSTTNPGTEPKDQLNHAKDDEVEEREDELYRYEDMPYIIGNVEDVQLYRKGGHHPVHLGDVLNDRFEVVHKLGSGGFGLVWLCYDTLHGKWRAIKVMTANHSKKGREKKIYTHLQQQASLERLTEAHLVVPLEEFWIEGPNGSHLCLVLPVLGASIDKWRLGLDPHDTKTVTDMKKFCFQVTEAVRFLHKSGICHGDLKPQNILVTVEGIDDMGKEEMLELIGEPECWEVETRSGDHPAPSGPEYIVQPSEEYWWEKRMSGSIAIIDFGAASLVSDPHEDNAWSMAYAAPEVLFCDKGLRGYHSDIWALAVTLFEIRAAESLFGGPPLELTVRNIELLLGGLPEPYRAGRLRLLASHYGRKYGENEGIAYKLGDPIDISTWSSHPAEWTNNDQLLEARNNRVSGTGYIDPLEATLGRQRKFYARPAPGEPRVVTEYQYPREEVLQLADLLRRMLHYDPAKRITINDVFLHPWIGGRNLFYTLYELINARAAILGSWWMSTE
ncbi:hypothetical protein ANO14919_007310 [Xylariales sp. No.14919]|nr:hypothetical protein ANO14919_007310 [Xylariales sp. No.14919]